MARSQPAGSNRNAGPDSHADAEAANTNAIAHASDQYPDGVPDSHRNGGAISYAHADCHIDAHEYAHAHLHSDPQAAYGNFLSDADSFADYRSCGQVGPVSCGKS